MKGNVKSFLELSGPMISLGLNFLIYKSKGLE